MENDDVREVGMKAMFLLQVSRDQHCVLGCQACVKYLVWKVRDMAAELLHCLGPMVSEHKESQARPSLRCRYSVTSLGCLIHFS